MNATGDKISQANESPDSTGSRTTYWVQNEAGVSNGGQTVILCNSHIVRPGYHFFRNKLHDRPDGWGKMGMVETNRCFEKIIPMVEGKGGNCKKIYRNNAHVPHSSYWSCIMGEYLSAGHKIVCTWINSKP